MIQETDWFEDWNGHYGWFHEGEIPESEVDAGPGCCDKWPFCDCEVQL